jgi:hypothetical protein
LIDFSYIIPAYIAGWGIIKCAASEISWPFWRLFWAFLALLPVPQLHLM